MNLLHEKNTASLLIASGYGLIIKTDERGENIYYQYTDEKNAKQTKIVFTEDYDNNTGHAETESIQPAFYTDEGLLYFIAEFIKNN